jgi:hypothetical protein
MSTNFSKTPQVQIKNYLLVLESLLTDTNMDGQTWRSYIVSPFFKIFRTCLQIIHTAEFRNSFNF